MYKFSFKVLTLATLIFAGCKDIADHNQRSISIEQFASLKSIKDYLITNFAITGFHGKSYCAYEVLGVEADAQNERIYLWVLCQEYYRVNQKLKRGTGGSFPLALTVQKKNNELYIISHQISYFGPDIPVFFPEKIRAKLRSETIINRNSRIRKLKNEVQHEAEADQLTRKAT